MTTVAARYQSASSDCGQGGSTRTTSQSPSACAASVSWSGSARPVPLGPPTKATVSTCASAGSPRISSAAACSTTSGAFSGWMRPANTMTGPSSGRPRRRRAALAGPGRKIDRSTPGLTVQILAGSAP